MTKRQQSQWEQRIVFPYDPRVRWVCIGFLAGLLAGVALWPF
jgi:hypothetical protein